MLKCIYYRLQIHTIPNIEKRHFDDLWTMKNELILITFDNDTWSRKYVINCISCCVLFSCHSCPCHFWNIAHIKITFNFTLHTFGLTNNFQCFWIHSNYNESVNDLESTFFVLSLKILWWSVLFFILFLFITKVRIVFSSRIKCWRSCTCSFQLYFSHYFGIVIVISAPFWIFCVMSYSYTFLGWAAILLRWAAMHVNI